ncbi:GNAT family N-acetyltransferase [Kibdelosporangium philippinense]|uniref:GNAT family N-acetyltransferase n=1 Tax=Kibdelosporangium philippinense TaxID=211113 RepID=A0ABS8Z7Z1_9PSEU|nr:GNAT family N-acetyltransferase [Kibdelosporangium philippinense]MCE7003998.1 GNAT family N-acetyltransferase [Kibdelosporangium philippinense]
MGDLQTERLSLRRPKTTDIAAIFAIHNDPQACAHNPSDALTTPNQAEGLFQRWDEHWQHYGFGYWVVRHQASEAQLGFCGLKSMEMNNRRILNLFYRLAPTSWGNGIATEAAKAVVTWATARLSDLPIIARVRPNNIASQRVATRAGLVRREHLDCEGFDGFDWIYASTWSD